MTEKRYRWVVQVPLNVTYESASEISRDSLVAEMSDFPSADLGGPGGGWNHPDTGPPGPRLEPVADPVGQSLMQAAAELGRVAVLAAALSAGGVASGEPIGRQEGSAPTERSDGQRSIAMRNSMRQSATCFR